LFNQESHQEQESIFEAQEWKKSDSTTSSTIKPLPGGPTKKKQTEK